MGVFDVAMAHLKLDLSVDKANIVPVSAAVVLLCLFLSGDIELNPGPKNGKKSTINCSVVVAVESNGLIIAAL